MNKIVSLRPRARERARARAQNTTRAERQYNHQGLQLSGLTVILLSVVDIIVKISWAFP
jgi:hypothetical protein